MRIPFYKMHGLGNDYVYVDGSRLEIADPVALSRAVSDRHRGIGSDGLVIVLPSSEATVRMRMWNADGSESAMCGNALRCVARLARDLGLASSDRVTIETDGRINQATVLDGGRVRASLGLPVLDRRSIPMLGDDAERVVDESFEIDGQTVSISLVSMGNPHVVIEVDQVNGAPVTTLGPRIETDARFPERTNVEFVEVTGRHGLRMRVWERGSGETQACGSGAGASVVAATLRGRVEAPVDVELLGGTLRIDWRPGGEVWMEGPATYAFEGVWPGADALAGEPAAARSR